MISEMNFDRKAFARGRNGFFYPKDAEFHKDGAGNIVISVFSARKGNFAPIYLKLSKKDAEVFSVMIENEIERV